jgi:hypothetical protein
MSMKRDVTHNENTNILLSIGDRMLVRRKKDQLSEIFLSTHLLIDDTRNLIQYEE